MQERIQTNAFSKFYNNPKRYTLTKPCFSWIFMIYEHFTIDLFGQNTKSAPFSAGTPHILIPSRKRYMYNH